MKGVPLFFLPNHLTPLSQETTIFLELEMVNIVRKSGELTSISRASPHPSLHRFKGLEDPIGGAGPSRAEEYEDADAGANVGSISLMGWW